MTGTTTVPTLTTAPAPTPTAIRPATPPIEPPAPEPTPTVPHQRQAPGRLRTDSPTVPTPTATATAPTVPLAPADAPADQPRTAAARTRTTGVRATQAGTTATDRRTAPHPDPLGTTTPQGRPADIRYPAPGATPTTDPQPSATAPTGPAGPPDTTDHTKLTDSTAPTGGPTGPSTPLARRPPRRPTGGPGRTPDRTRRPAAPAITTRTTPDRTAPGRPAPSGPRPAGPRPSGPRLTRPATGAAYAPAPAYTPGDTYPDRTTRDRPAALTDIAAATAAAGRRPDAGGAPLPTVGARRRAHEHRPHHWFAHQLLLTLSGQRPVHALLGHALPAAYDRLVELAPQAPLRPATGPGRRALAPSVRDCGLCRPRGGVIEAFARIAAGERLRALAFRLELGADSRWRCAALDIGPTCAVRGPAG
ncbi:Rv3235 family protein [Streptomyces celluloflavus]|uniref:Rv3235 family protein n=1 Tax=Streptomyces celluloflavus TaxID=58344 RepID=UPI0036DCEB79